MIWIAIGVCFNVAGRACFGDRQYGRAGICWLAGGLAFLVAAVLLDAGK